ncbi:MAG: FtsX-like permease family protein [Arachnia sp.]
MIALARLLNGGRGDRWRLLAIVGGVALGTALALALWTGFTALAERDLRSTWIDPNRQWTDAVHLDDGTALPADALLVYGEQDSFEGRRISILRVSAAADTTATVPGIGRPPAPGTAVLSPALAALVEARPRDQLGDRFPSIAGVLPDDVLAGPDALVAVVGARPDDIAYRGLVLTALQGTEYATENYRVVALIGAFAVGLPVVILLGIVTALGSARRGEQLATLRLIGAAPGALARIAAWETAATSCLGVAAGVALAWLVAPVLSMIELGGSRFFPDDLQPGPWPSAILGVGIVALAVGIAAVRARRLAVGPLGAARERVERTPGWWRIVPLPLGLVGIQIDDLVPVGFVLVSVGLLTAGPLLLSWLAGLWARLAQSTAMVIALARLRLHPRRTFRAVSGLVIACFVVSVFAGARTTLTAPVPGDDAARTTLVAALAPAADQPLPAKDDPALRAAVERLRQVPGITGVDIEGETGAVELIVTVADDGPALERARTALQSGREPLTHPPLTEAERLAAANSTWATDYAVLAFLGVLVAGAVSALALAVATLAGILDRRRVFGLLRLTGMPPRTLGRIVAAEAGIPLLATFAGVALLGHYVARVIVTTLTDGRRSTGWPSADYYVVLAACLGIAALAVAVTARAARSGTGTLTRFE